MDFQFDIHGAGLFNRRPAWTGRSASWTGRFTSFSQNSHTVMSRTEHVHQVDFNITIPKKKNRVLLISLKNVASFRGFKVLIKITDEGIFSAGVSSGKTTWRNLQRDASKAEQRPNSHKSGHISDPFLSISLIRNSFWLTNIILELRLGTRYNDYEYKRLIFVIRGKT